jgi:hypothetical protein
MANLATLWPMSAALREAAESQDMIGWIEFLHSKVSTKFWSIQRAHCIMAGTRISGDDWMTQFTRQLLDISHAQWLYRNFTLHHYTKGYLCQRTERDIKQEVEILVYTKPTDIPKESCYLLDISFKPTTSTSVVDVLYWVLAMKAAKNYLQRQEWAKAEQGAGAQQQATKISRNLLDGVEDSLQKQLNVDKPAAKRTLEQKGHTTKQPCIELVIPSITQPPWGTLESFWQHCCSDLFVFG